MKRLALAALVALVLVAAAPATAAGPTLRSLQYTLDFAPDNKTLAVAGLAYGACTSAVTADALQGTWTALDGRFVSQGQTALFGVQTPVNDFNFCQGFSVVRARNQNPPTVSVFQALLNIFK